MTSGEFGTARAVMIGCVVVEMSVFKKWQVGCQVHACQCSTQPDVGLEVQFIGEGQAEYQRVGKCMPELMLQKRKRQDAWWLRE